MSECYLCMQEVGIKKKLYFYSENDFAKVTELKKKTISRNSPLFSIYPQQKQPPQLNKSCHVTLLFPKLSFQSIGQIVNKVDQEIQKNIWFSHGLASIIIFSKEEDTANEVIDLLENQLSAIEKWYVNKNTIELDKCVYEFKPSVNFDVSKFQIYFKAIENIDILDLLNEFTLSMNRLVNLSAQYTPALMFTLSSIVSNVQELINDLVYLTNCKINGGDGEMPPLSLVKDNARDLSSEDNGIQKRIFQRIGSIVEIVSTISYIDSQLFGCVAPVLNNNYRISSNSLLGVGSAYLGIIGFTQFIEKGFYSFPVTKVIDSFFHDKDAFDCNSLFEYNSDLWENYDFNIDDKFKDIQKDPVKSSLIYLSRRLGFKETRNTISSPWQVVPFGDSVPWSLMTLSHELLHSHVRSILGAIFKCPSSETTKNWFNELCLQYQKKLPVGTESKDSGDKNHLIDSIRMMIFEYCHYSEECSNISFNEFIMAKEKGIKVFRNLEQKGPDSILGRLSGYFNSINEIFVHVLDYHYFYDCNSELYIGLLWESWSTVPTVLADIKIYLLRSMIAIGTEVKTSVSFQ